MVTNHDADLAGVELGKRADRVEPHHPHERADDARIEPLAGSGLEQRQRLPPLLGLTVRSVARDRVEAVRHRHDPREQGRLAMAAEGRIPGGVVRRVVLQHDRCRRMEEIPRSSAAADRSRRPGGAARSATAPRRGARLLQDLAGDLDLADVVKQRADPRLITCSRPSPIACPSARDRTQTLIMWW